MKPETKLKKSLQLLMRSYQKEGGANRMEDRNVPSQKQAIAILSCLRSLLFPGYYHDNAVTTVNFEYTIGQRLAWVQENLSREINRSLCYRCKQEGKCKETSKCRKKAEAVVWELIEELPAIRALVMSDIEAAFKGDPAAKSRDEIILAYPGLAAISVQRLAHFLWERDEPLIARIMTEHIHHETGIDIHPGAKIGKGFFIDHGTGVVIGETTVIGNNVKLYQEVTLGALSVKKKSRLARRHPTIEDDVTIYAGATILGARAVIGRGSIIGGNVWLVHSVPPNSRIYIKEPELVITTNGKKKQTLTAKEY